MHYFRGTVISIFFTIALALSAQDISIPNVIRFSGTTSLAQEQPGAVLGATFLIYKDSTGGSPLWIETQNIRPDAYGRYTVLLGSEHAGGVPQDLFRSGEARWISTRFAGEPEGERLRLVSVPYAVEAANAETLEGHPITDFVLADELRKLQALWSAPRSDAAVTGAVAAAPEMSTVVNSGTANALAKFTDADTVGATTGVYESGGKIGVGTTAPAAGVHISAALPRAFIQATTPGNNAGLWFESRPPDTKLASKRGGVYFLAGNTPQNTFVGFTGNDLTYHLVATQAGDVGVGTTNPQARFHVAAPVARAYVQSTTPGSNAEFRLGGLSSTSAAHFGGIYFQAGDTRATNYLALSGDDISNHLVVTSAGDVGVGTANPASKFEVAGDVRLSGGGVLRFSDGTTQATAAGGKALAAADTSVKIEIAPTSTNLSVADLGVTSAKLADNSVTNSKIADASISLAKLQPSVLSNVTVADASISALKLADGAVTASKIVDGSVNASKIADGSITAAKIQPSVLTSITPADASVTTAKLVDSSITASKIVDGAITASKIPDASISAAKLQPSVLALMTVADGSISALKLADGSVTSNKLLDGSVTGAKIPDASISAAKLADNSVGANKILDGSVTASKIPDGSISATKLQPSVLALMTVADGSISALKLADGSVTTNKILDGSVTGAKIPDASISAAKLADNSVTTNKILDGSVTASKIPDASISATKLQPSVLALMTVADGSISALKLADGSVTTNKILDGSVTASKIPDGSITAAKLQSSVLSNIIVADGSISTTKIADGSVTSAKIATGGIAATKITGTAATLGSNAYSGAQTIYGTIVASNTAASAAITGTNTSGTDAAVLARNTSLSGPAYGTRSETQSVTGIASYGYASAASGFTRGFQGRVDSPDGTAVEGIAYSGTGSTVALHGITYSASSKAVLAESTASIGTNYAIYAEAGGDTNSAGVYASATNNVVAVTYGVYAKSAATLGVGVLGYSTSTSGTTSGVYGRVDSPSGAAGEFDNGAGGNVFIGRSRTLKVARIDGTGKLFVNGGTQTGGADFAESVRVRGDRAEYEPGDVLVIDPENNRQLSLSNSAYATAVAGIYSTKPGVLATPHEMDSTEFAREIPLAMIGIVPCKASAENGPVHRGDLLVTSTLPGHVMRGTDRSRMLGAIVGKALQPLESGTGVIECMVTLQ